jgi:hypothetical protein
VRGSHCEERNAKSAIADFVKKRRSNPEANSAIGERLPLDCFASLAMTPLVLPSSALRPLLPARGEKGANDRCSCGCSMPSASLNW